MSKQIAMAIRIPEEKEADFRHFILANDGLIEESETRGYRYMGNFINPSGDGKFVVHYCGEDVVFDAVDDAVKYISDHNEKPLWEVTFIWGHNLKVMTLTVPADNQEYAVGAAFSLVGDGFENRLISVVRL